MRRPQFITFTGVDDRTDLMEVRRLSALYPIEWAVLFSPKRQGLEPRYPALSTIRAVVGDEGAGLRLAAHLCGRHARDVVDGDGNVTLPDFENGEDVPNPAWFGRFARVQINHTDPSPERIAAFVGSFSGERRGIAQCRGASFPAAPDVDWLFDCSGGRGQSPSVWPAHPADGRLVGYAGGIGPDNVLDVLASLDAGGPFTIDMESRIRTTDDWLDLRKCRAVCEAVFGPPGHR